METNTQNKFATSADAGGRTIPNESEDFPSRPANSDSFRTVPQDSENFRNVPHNAEGFGKLPKDSERFRTVPHPSERQQNHTLSVREVARLFETAGVARTERSITNWCQRNKMGVARLDSYFDPNERKYFITRESVDSAIQEEKAKAAKGSEALSEEVPNVSESAKDRRNPNISQSTGDTEELRKELMDLKIANRGKDLFIEQLQKERDHFQVERQGYIGKLMNFTRKIGQLETKLFQLGTGEDPAHAKEPVDELPGEL